MNDKPFWAGFVALFAFWMLVLSSIVKPLQFYDWETLWHHIATVGIITFLVAVLVAMLMFFNEILDLTRDNTPIEETDFLC